ncbi:MAG: ribonuclease H-like domain-containing protein [Archangium sp.]|nr:ribonuclease H-like domain-containing protein [Archangium sp.]
MEFLERTFQLTKGVGPWREKDLWARDIATWSDFEKAAADDVVMNERLDRELLEAIAIGRDALKRRSLKELAELVPAREHWRIYGHFIDSASFFDIEADGDEVPTVVGVMDKEGVASFRRGHSLQQLPDRLAASPIWVTFNGSVFDVPTLHKAFDLGEKFPKPLVHLDLRFLIRHAKLKGGLKGVEETIGLGRPPHLKGVKGLDAIRLWREWNERKDKTALRLLVEYNLYDAINLRSVLEWTLWRTAELNAWSGVEKRPIFERGDVLYDVSRLVLGL